MSGSLLLGAFIVAQAVPTSAQASQKRPKLPPKILSEKFAYFENQTAWPAVGAKALSQLRKWGRFHIVQDKAQAQLVLSLAEDPNLGRHVTQAGGQTGTVNSDGTITEDSIPVFDPEAVMRYVHLTVADRQTGEVLWTGSHRWGGLLTGFDSAGERVMKQFQKEVGKWSSCPDAAFSRTTPKCGRLCTRDRAGAANRRLLKGEP